MLRDLVLTFSILLAFCPLLRFFLLVLFAEKKRELDVPCEKPLGSTVEVISTDFIDIDVFQLYWTNNENKIPNVIPYSSFFFMQWKYIISNGSLWPWGHRLSSHIFLRKLVASDSTHLIFVWANAVHWYWCILCIHIHRPRVYSVYECIMGIHPYTMEAFDHWRRREK